MTIKYRTIIDGVPVPQELPLRLLVLGELTSRSGKVPQQPFEQRPVVSIKRGTRVDDIMRDYGMSLPIPTGTESIYRNLAEGTAVLGTVRTPDQAGAALKGRVASIGADATCAVSGALEFQSVGASGQEGAFAGALAAAGKVQIAAKLLDEDVVLEGRYTSKVTGSVPNATGTWTTEGDKVVFTVDLPDVPVKSSALAADPWQKGQLAGKLEGKVQPDATNPKKGTLTVATVERGDVTLTVTGHTDAPLELNASVSGVAVENNAADGAPASWQPEQGAPITLTIDSEFPVIVAYKAKAKALVADTNGALGVGAGGKLTADVATGAVTLAARDAKDAWLSFAPAGKLVGKLESSLDDFGRGKLLSVGLRFESSVTAGEPCALEGDLPVALSIQEAALHGTGVVRDHHGTSGDVCTAEIQAVSVSGTELSLDDFGNLAVTVVNGQARAQRTIPLFRLESFTPDTLAEHIPQVRRLRVIRNLLMELKSDASLSTPARTALVDELRKLNGTTDHLRTLRGKYQADYPALRAPEELKALATREKGLQPKPEPVEAPRELSRQEKASEQAWIDGEYPAVERRLFDAFGLEPEQPSKQSRLALVETQGVSAPGLGASQALFFKDRYAGDDGAIVVDDHDRMRNSLAALVLNAGDLTKMSSKELLAEIDAIVERVDIGVKKLIGFVLKDENFRTLERNWRSVAQICDTVTDEQVIIDVLDVSKDELRKDLTDHSGDIFTSALFKKVYVDEYDRFGGKPFGAMIGLYDFDCSDEDMEWLTTMSQIANAAHCPFVAAAGPQFFGTDVNRWSDLEQIGDAEAHLNLPKFGKWNVLRQSGEAPYVGLTMPGFLLRRPWSSDGALHNRVIGLDEVIAEPDADYLWASSAILFAQNMIRSFEGSAWCQYLRGVKGGGLVQGLTVHTVSRHGKEEVQSPVQIEIADYRELQLARAGLIPLVHCKGTSDAAFFSAQSIRKPQDFMDEVDTQNSYLVANLAYTLSITRIAHYVKRMMRDYIGSIADAPYIQNTLQLWLNDYITTVVNPDDLTLRYYPFKAAVVDVTQKPGPLGWYKATIKILPHVQFEGMDVELRLEAALGGK